MCGGGDTQGVYEPVVSWYSQCMLVWVSNCVDAVIIFFIFLYVGIYHAASAGVSSIGTMRQIDVTAAYGTIIPVSGNSISC